MKLALVHDYLREWGGAEEVLKTFHEIWPESPIFTSYATSNVILGSEATPESALSSLPSNAKADPGQARMTIQGQIKTTWMNYLPNGLKSWRGLTPLLPLAFRQFDFSAYDVVLSSSASFAKTVQVKKPAIHICYCHTPPRFLYGLQRERSSSGLTDLLEMPFLPFLTKADQDAARRVDYFLANSDVVAQRIKHIYNRPSTVIYPPVATNKFVSDNNDRGVEKQYFVTIGRLSAIKHFELAVEACTKLNIPLKVIGEGTELENLKKLAGPTVAFLGRLTDQEITKVLKKAKAVISTVLDEDFGILPLEVLGAGVPVIAAASPASKETMINGTTGIFFEKPTVDALAQAILKFDESRYNPQVLRNHAAQFGKERFAKEIKAFVEKATK